MYLIDSHCHLTDESLSGQLAGVLGRARETGVREFVTIATDLADAERALALAADEPSIHVVAGIHPHQAGKVGPGFEVALRKFAIRQDVFAVGEMGLDYHYDFADRDAQKQVFRQQIELASEARKPIVIHCREAHDDVMAMLSEFPGLDRVVFHCFTGTLPEAREILDAGYWLSLTGVVTFKRSDVLREVAKLLPDDRLMVETDSPYLAPEPVRHHRPNEPANMVHTAACIAAARGVTLETLARQTVDNTRRFFGLPDVALHHRVE